MIQLDLFISENELIKDQLLKDVEQLMNDIILYEDFPKSLDQRFTQHSLRQKIIEDLEKVCI